MFTLAEAHPCRVVLVRGRGTVEATPSAEGGTAR